MVHRSKETNNKICISGTLPEKAKGHPQWARLSFTEGNAGSRGFLYPPILLSTVTSRQN